MNWTGKDKVKGRWKEAGREEDMTFRPKSNSNGSRHEMLCAFPDLYHFSPWRKTYFAFLPPDKGSGLSELETCCSMR